MKILHKIQLDNLADTLQFLLFGLVFIDFYNRCFETDGFFQAIHLVHHQKREGLMYIKFICSYFTKIFLVLKYLFTLNVTNESSISLVF